MSMNTRLSSENPPAPLGDLGDLGARVPLNDLVLPFPVQEVAVLPAAAGFFAGWGAFEIGLGITAVSVGISAMLVDKKSAADALMIALENFHTSSQEMQAQFRQQIGPLLKDLSLALQQSGADIKGFLKSHLLPGVPGWAQGLVKQMIESLPDSAFNTPRPLPSVTQKSASVPHSLNRELPNRIASQPSSPPRTGTHVDRSASLTTSRPLKLNRTVPGLTTSSRKIKKNPSLPITASPAKHAARSVNSSKRAPSTAFDWQAVLGPNSAIKGCAIDLNSAVLLLKSASLSANPQQLLQAQSNLKTAYQNWAQEILKPELKALADKMVTAAAGGSPLKPPDDKPAQMLLAALANGLGSLLGMGLETLMGSDDKPEKNLNRLLIALLVGAAVPPGTTLVGKMASNALSNFLDEVLGQFTGTYKKDSAAYVGAIASGVVGEGIGHFLGPQLAKGLKRWERAIVGVRQLSN